MLPNAADVLKLRQCRAAFTHGVIPIGDDRVDAGFRLGDNASLELDEMIRFVSALSKVGRQAFCDWSMFLSTDYAFEPINLAPQWP